MIRFQFVEDHRTEYSVKRMCTVLGLNRSSYYKWKASSAQRHRRLIDDAMLGAKIKAVFNEKDQLYGAKRIAAELTYNDAYNDNGPVNHKRIARIMKKLRLRGYTKKRKVTTTRRGPHRVVFACSPTWSSETSRHQLQIGCSLAISPICRSRTGRICISLR